MEKKQQKYRSQPTRLPDAQINIWKYSEAEQAELGVDKEAQALMSEHEQLLSAIGIEVKGQGFTDMQMIEIVKAILHGMIKRTLADGLKRGVNFLEEFKQFIKDTTPNT